MKILYFAILLLPVVLGSCHTKSGGTEAKVTQETLKSAVVFNADSAYNFIKQQLDCGPRVPGTPGHKACADLIVNTLGRYGADTILLQPTTVENYLGGKMPIVNIMGRFNTDSARRVLLVAHWDTRPWADNDPKVENRGTPVPGANDGGSGTAVLLEMARLMHEKRPDIGIDLLFVDGEDSGRNEGWGSNENTWCLGTQYWVNHMPYSGNNLPEYGILLDMVGGNDAKFHKEYVSEQEAAHINDKVWQIAAASGYGKQFPTSVHGGVTDDHIFINRAGIPCIDIIECSNHSTGTFPPTWHTLQDNLSNIDKKTLKAVGQTVANTIYREKN